MDNRIKRSSNIELLRIIMMIAIVAHHFVVNSGVTQLYDFPANIWFCRKSYDQWISSDQWLFYDQAENIVQKNHKTVSSNQILCICYLSDNDNIRIRGIFGSILIKDCFFNDKRGQCRIYSNILSALYIDAIYQ